MAPASPPRAIVLSQRYQEKRFLFRNAASMSTGDERVA